MHAYSQDLRDRVLRALERGERPSDIARRLEVSRVWVYDVSEVPSVFRLPKGVFHATCFS